MLLPANILFYFNIVAVGEIKRGHAAQFCKLLLIAGGLVSPADG